MNEQLKNHFLALYKLALSDGSLDMEELELLYKIGLERGISREEINEIVISPGVTTQVPDSLEDKIRNLYDLVRIAWADGIIDQEERKLIKNFCLRYGFYENNIEAITDFLLDEVSKGTSYDDLFLLIKETL